jgi:hypothetical protein
MISSKERGRVYVEEQAHGGANDRGAQAAGGRAQGRRHGEGSGCVETYPTAKVPAGATTSPVSVVTSGGTLTSSHIFLAVPTIKTISPTSGLVGTVTAARSAAPANQLSP